MRAGWLFPALFSGCVALASTAVAQTVTGAQYSGPTSAYPHAVLGDALEWSVLEVRVARPDGTSARYSIEAPENMVYEDIAPRLWDVTGDGSPEVVAILSHQSLGARLAVFGWVDDALQEIARTPHIGTRFRWLAPVAAADFDGDGHVEIAYVDRPHLAKTLRIWRYTPESFREIASLQGVTNHRIGEEFITGGLRDCGEGPEMILADAGWRNVMSVRASGVGYASTVLRRFDGPSSVATAMACD